MQQSQRAECNHALEYAVQRANELKQPVLVVFGLMDNYPEANLRHYSFMLQGLRETQSSLAERGIKMVLRHGAPPEVAATLARRASLIVCDRGYLRHQKQWRRAVAKTVSCAVLEVESDVVVPIGVVSSKAEFAARTIRPKLNKHLDRYLVALRTTTLERDSLNLQVDGLQLADIPRLLSKLKIDRSVGSVQQFFAGGTARAKERLRDFIRKKSRLYVKNRNQPQTDDVSHLGMYLHFGQLSPLAVALAIRGSKSVPEEAKAAFLEELIVRRELAANYTNYTPEYDSFKALPDWAKRTLGKHQADTRHPAYTRRELEQARTRDPYWNAAMLEMRETGYMHNYMRMYWGKKILEWCGTPEHAFRTALTLNNKYFLDGRDPNSFAGVAWTFGLHDRPWGERPIFGQVRYMAASGLERKCDIEAYVRKVEARTRTRVHAAASNLPL
jgi:deoxyribodipyrimidine photo-lyase